MTKAKGSSRSAIRAEAWRRAAGNSCAVFGNDFFLKVTVSAIPMYSGYMVTLPLVSAFWISSVEPMFSLYWTVKPFASRACL